MAVSRQRSASFSAPWGRSVKITTFATLALPVVMAVVFPLVMPREALWAVFLGPVVLAVVFGITWLFCVRGYAVRRGELWIRRSYWETRVPLAGLSRAWADPDAMRRAIRSAGNGGLFAFTGWFQNKKLGKFQAWVTDPKRAVVLEFENRKIVVSPDRPRRFLRALGAGENSEPGQR